MWISRMIASKLIDEKAEKGRVITNNDGQMEAGSTLFSKNISEYAPYGYQVSVPTGEEVIIVNSTDGQIALGTKNIPSNQLENGEIKISSKGGANIILKNDGSVVINSLVIDKNGVIKN